jgi:cytochrome b561
MMTGGLAMARPTGYSRAQIALHWAVVVLVVLQYLLHDGIAGAYDLAEETGVYAVSPLVIAHIAGGGAILLLACWRLILRNDRGVPPPPEGEPEVFARLSRIAHLTFYALLILLPITGALAWGGQMALAGRGARGAEGGSVAADRRPCGRGGSASDGVENRRDAAHDHAAGLKKAVIVASNSRGRSACSQCPAPGILANFAFGKRRLMAGRWSGLT